MRKKADDTLQLSTSINRQAYKKSSKYEYYRLFRRGCNLTSFQFFLSIVFFVAWIIGNSRERYLVADSTSMSRIFFFLNPNIFRQIILEGNALSWVSGALDFGSFIFLICYILALFSFVIMVGCAFWLFLISYHTSVKFFHTVACLSLLPIVSCFVLAWLCLKMLIYKVENRILKRVSRFEADFTPEKFDEPTDRWDERYLATRPFTSYFGYSEYQTHYKTTQEKDKLHQLLDQLKEYLK